MLLAGGAEESLITIALSRRRPQLRDRLGRAARSRRRRLLRTRKGCRTSWSAKRPPIGGFEVNAGGGDDSVTVAREVPIPVTLRGGPGDDRLVGGGAGDKLIGGPGDDVLIGRAGDDSLFGGPGNDLLVRRQRQRPPARRSGERHACSAAPASNSLIAAELGGLLGRAPAREQVPPTKRSATRKPTSESAASSRKPAWMPSTKGGIAAGEDGRGQAQADRAAGDLEHVDDAAGEAGLRFVDRGDARRSSRSGRSCRSRCPSTTMPGTSDAVAGAGVDLREEEGRDGDAGGAEDRQRLGAEAVVERPGDEGDERRRRRGRAGCRRRPPAASSRTASP